MSDNHVPVFIKEIENLIQHYSPGLVIDLTFGRGGYSKAALVADKNNHVIAFDLDYEAIEFAAKSITDSRFKIIHDNYKNFSQYVSETPRIIIADLGLSSPQIDQAHRGMSIRFGESLLDLRFNLTQGEPAWKILPTLSVDTLTNILEEFGELTNARKLAVKLIDAARQAPLRVFDAVRICESSSGRKNISALVFQAIRIFLNDELQALDDLLFELKNRQWENVIVAIVTFHSLEDRTVKRRAKEFKWKEVMFLKSVSKEELRSNSRSGSARLRVYEI